MSPTVGNPLVKPHEINHGFVTMWPMVAVVLLAIGCEKSSESTHIQGKVTYRGKPVPAGRIIIDPGHGQANEKTRGFAAIRDGVYDTSQEGGVAPTLGPVVFIVSGYDGKNKSELMPQGMPLFETYRHQVYVELGANVIDIEVRGRHK